MSNRLLEQKNTGESRRIWLGYGAEFLTIFFALAVLTGRVYAQSYWNVFGLSSELIGNTFVDYAIMSPNAVLASVLMAVGTVAMIIFILLMRQPYDFVGDHSPRVLYFIGWLAFWAGLLTIGIITKVNSSTWTAGTAGIAFGLGYIFAIIGQVIWVQAALKLQKKEQSKLDKILIGWINKLPFTLVGIFFAIVIVSVGLWGILDTAQTFGANEAKFMYDMRPIVTLQLDSPEGFEDLPLTSTVSGASLLKAKIITEAGGFLYFSIGVTQTPHQLHVRAVPVSRIQAIQYAVDVTPLGK